MNTLLRSLLITLAMTGSAYAAPIAYITTLSGANEIPANLSAGTGSVRAVIDVVAHTLSLNINFQGLTGNTTAAHIHSGTAIAGAGTIGASTADFAGFPFGVNNGTYVATLNTAITSSFTTAFITANGGTAAGAEAKLASDLAAGKAYFNIHTSAVPSGEIRGFLAVPEAEQTGLILLGLTGLLVRNRFKKA